MNHTKKLSPNKEAMLFKYYLETCKSKTLQDVATNFGVTITTVSKIISKFLKNKANGFPC